MKFKFRDQYTVNVMDINGNLNAKLVNIKITDMSKLLKLAEVDLN